MPSAMAVLPTPGSPTSIGLFFVLRERMCNVLRISSSRPITGSSLPCLASSFKFLAYLFSALNSCDCVCDVTVSPFLRSLIAAINPFSVSPVFFNSLAVESFPCTMASNKCSVVTNSSLNCLSTAPALKTTLFASRLICWAASPDALGNLLMSSSSLLSTRLTVTLFFFSKYSTGESC